jgi:hypothetical protein
MVLRVCNIAVTISMASGRDSRVCLLRNIGPTCHRSSPQRKRFHLEIRGSGFLALRCVMSPPVRSPMSRYARNKRCERRAITLVVAEFVQVFDRRIKCT